MGRCFGIVPDDSCAPTGRGVFFFVDRYMTMNDLDDAKHK